VQAGGQAIIDAVYYPTSGSLQHLALLGGEGLRPESSTLWHELLARVGQTPRVAVLPVALSTIDSAQAERRATTSRDALRVFGAEADLITQDTEASNANIIYLPGGDQRSVCELLPSSSVWTAICRPGSSIKMLIASGGSAVALAEHAFAPIKPYPAAPGDLMFEHLSGMGLIKNAAILPYFSWLQDEVIRKIADQLSNCVLIGIDDQAALISGADGWQVAGLGTVSIFRSGQPLSISDPGTIISPDSLIPFP
jgi:hypothetical protein